MRSNRGGGFHPPSPIFFLAWRMGSAATTPTRILRQRRYLPKPRVGVRHESLPWDTISHPMQPQRGCVRMQRPSARTQPRWGWDRSLDLPRVGRHTAVQPWAVRQIPVGEKDLRIPTGFRPKAKGWLYPAYPGKGWRYSTYPRTRHPTHSNPTGVVSVFHARPPKQIPVGEKEGLNPNSIVP